MAMRKIKICITGCSGFIGSNLNIYLKQRKEIQIIPFFGNLFDKKEIENFFAKNKNINQIIYLVGGFFGDFEELYRLNVLTVHNLLVEASKRKVKKIIFASTGAVYGEPKRLESIESDPICPNTVYGLTKMMAEEVIRYFANNYGLDYVILRFPNIYGPGQTKGVIFNFLKDIRERGKITVNGDGKQTRNFLHVTDACLAIEKSIFYKKSGIFNISNPQNISILDLIKIFKKRYIFEVVYQKANNNLQNLSLNINKAKKELRFYPKVKEI